MPRIEVLKYSALLVGRARSAERDQRILGAVALSRGLLERGFVLAQPHAVIISPREPSVPTRGRAVRAVTWTRSSSYDLLLHSFDAVNRLEIRRSTALAALDLQGSTNGSHSASGLGWLGPSPTRRIGFSSAFKVWTADRRGCRARHLGCHREIYRQCRLPGNQPLADAAHWADDARTPLPARKERIMDRRLLTLAIGMFAVGTDSFVIAGVLPEISRSFKVSIAAAGQLTTVYALTYALLSPVAAATLAHIDRKNLMLSGLGLFVVGNLATAWAPTFALALVARMFASLGASMYSPTATGAGAAIMPPERRGYALSVVIAGLTLSTALGSPIGTVIGGLGNWRYTMVFVSAISAAAGFGIFGFMRNIPLSPAITLKQRFAPFTDRRVGLILLTTVLVQCGTFTIYTYFSVIFGPVIKGNALVFGALLSLMGVAGSVMNLIGGRLIDSVGTRKVLNAMLVMLVVVSATLSVTSSALLTVIAAIALFGACSWGQLGPQQHRLVSIIPHAAPIVLGLNTSGTYIGVASAGLVGAAAISIVGARNVGWVSCGLYVAALIVAEVAHRAIVRRSGGTSVVALA
jgi:predicted MFS family arabinose efflux permease